MNGMTWRGDFPGECEQLANVRRIAGALLEHSQVRDDAIACLVELAGNAILHSRSARGVFTVGIWSAEGVARVAVQDAGGWDEPVVRSGGEELLAEGGRGLAIVVALADRLGVARDEDGRVVWADLSCGGAQGGGVLWGEVPLLEAVCGRCRLITRRSSQTVFSAVDWKG
ncbi:ATP-binding protein [Nonomuraea sp. NPDC048882]|uniref:ATP-binding protein n=1 Tax=Nonomuraea sp. NPDC048882 TaxID=3154347 RepID=UPI0033E4C98B